MICGHSGCKGGRRGSVWMLVHSLRRRKGGISRGLRLLLRWQRLAMGTIEHHRRTSAAVLRVSEMRIGSVCRHKCLCLG